VRLETLIDMPCVMTGVWQRLGVHVFHGRVTVSDMDEMERRGDGWARRNPGNRAEMTIIMPSDTVMTSEERTRMVKIIKKWERVRIASATVILAKGITGAAHRSVLTAFLLLAPPPNPTKVFGATHAAVDWIAPHVAALCGPEATQEALRNAVDDLCHRFRAGRSLPALSP
jgi:hypothetical protein